MELPLLFAFISSVLALPSGKRFDRHQVLRVKPLDADQVNLIKNISRTIQLDFWRPHSADRIVIRKRVDFRVSAEQSQPVRTLLEKNGLSYKVVVNDVQDAIEKQFSDHKRRPEGGHSYNRYNDWDTIAAWSEKIAKEYPKLVSRIQIGSTTEDRPMYILKVGKQSPVKKAIYMDCGMHAREWISPAFCQWFVKEAITFYGKDKKMTNLLDKMTFLVIPVVNVDGYVWSWIQDRMWRKNRSLNPGSDCVGTDLNRNFPIGWDLDETSNDTCSEIYGGSKPESEKEIKAVVAFIQENIHSIKSYISVHAYSQMLMFPYGYKFELPPNNEELSSIAEAAVKELTILYNTKYRYGPIATTIYPTGGSSLDWVYEEGVKYTFAFELRDDGDYGFLLPEYLIRPTCKETMLAVKYIANYVLEHSN